jgi:hypothetical protein
MDKSPGYPLNLQYQTNGQAFADVGDLLILSAVARLHMWLDPDIPYDEISKDPWDLIITGFFDPSSVFNKNEPHPARKLKEGRFRCIDPVSVVTNLCECAMFSESSSQMKINLFESGSSVGISFTDQGMSAFYNFCKTKTEQFGPAKTDDVSGFDSVHTPQTLYASARVDELSHESPYGLTRWNVANRRWCCQCSKSCVILGQSIYTKIQLGMLNTGSRDTSRRNTTLRDIYTDYFYISASGEPSKFTTANGDDAISWGPVSLDAYKESAAIAGFALRDVVERTDNFQFCSHEYSTSGAFLTSWPKSVYRILTSTSIKKSDAYQFLYELRHNKEYGQVKHFIDLCDLPEQ